MAAVPGDAQGWVGWAWSSLVRWSLPMAEGVELVTVGFVHSALAAFIIFLSLAIVYLSMLGKAVSFEQ